MRIFKVDVLYLHYQPQDMDKLYKSFVLFVGLIAMNLTVQAQDSVHYPNLSSDSEVATNSVFVHYDSSIAMLPNESWRTISFFPKAKQATNFTNYPNPATTFTTVSYILTAKTNVLLKVIDLAGKQLAVLIKREQNTGKQEFYWDFAKNNITSGMYILLLQVDGKTYSRKIIVQ